MIVPAYGPNWQFKIPKTAPLIWHILAIHHPKFRSIQVAPYNRRRRKKGKQR